MIKNLIYKIGYKRFLFAGIIMGILALYFYLSKFGHATSNEERLYILFIELFAQITSFLFLLLSFFPLRAKDLQRVVEAKPSKQQTLLGLIIFIILYISVGIVGIIMWTSSKHVPEADLTRIEGTVIECAKKGNSGDVNFKISSSSLSFKYINWYPNNRLVNSSIEVGKRIQIWYSLKDPQGLTTTIWQVSNGKDTLVSYVEMSSRRKLNRFAALAISVFSFSAIFYVVYKWLRANQALKLTVASWVR
jgi:hypothetical protein